MDGLSENGIEHVKIKLFSIYAAQDPKHTFCWCEKVGHTCDVLRFTNRNSVHYKTYLIRNDKFCIVNDVTKSNEIVFLVNLFSLKINSSKSFL